MLPILDLQTLADFTLPMHTLSGVGKSRITLTERPPETWSDNERDPSAYGPRNAKVLPQWHLRQAVGAYAKALDEVLPNPGHVSIRGTTLKDEAACATSPRMESKG